MRSTIPFGPSSLAIGSARPYADLNSVFQSFFQDLPASARATRHELRADIRENGAAYELVAEIPGVKREEIELQVLGDQLSLSGSFGPAPEPGAEGQARQRTELRFGAFRRDFTLPGPVDMDGVHAALENGILRVHLPKAASAMPRQIKVQGEGENS